MSESAILKRIMLACSNGATRLFRNNVGMLQDRNGIRVRYGLCQGSSDLIGFSAITVTPAMVGKTVAVFTAIEVKRETGGTVSAAQMTFLSAVSAAGGIAGVARSEDEAKAIINGYMITRGH